jgi:hypothetical protein
MAIACVNHFSACFRDRDSNVMFGILGPGTLAPHALGRSKYLLESVNCDILPRIGVALLNKLMGTTEPAENVG